jgi:hypothetical protein
MAKRAYKGLKALKDADSELVHAHGLRVEISIGGVAHDKLVYNRELGVWQTDESFSSGAFGQQLAACCAAPDARLTSHQFSFLRGDIAAFSGVTNKAGALQRVYESVDRSLGTKGSAATLQDKVLLALWQIAWYRYQHARQTFENEHMSGKLSRECQKALSVLNCIERYQEATSSSACTHEFDTSDVFKSVKDALKHYN